MSPKEFEILSSALNTLSGIQIDYHNYSKQRYGPYNFEALGKAVLAKRALAELLGLDINNYLLPNEEKFEPFDEDNFPNDRNDWVRFTQTSTSEALTDKEKVFLNTVVLPIFHHLYGVSDSDNACMRCVTRMIAEVAGYHNLDHFRLLKESEVKPVYFLEYTVFKGIVSNDSYARAPL